jgi:mannose-6-phosphate isomerase-like protein (cupin superfamily)
MTNDVVRSGDAILCYIIRSGSLPTQTEFITPGDRSLQVGHIVHPRGYEIARHAHRPVSRHITGTAEVLLVQRGRCEMDVYDDRRHLVATRDLRVGDVVVLLGGGHGFRMIEDTVLLEVKQGPYLGPGEKEQF